MLLMVWLLELERAHADLGDQRFHVVDDGRQALDIRNRHFEGLHALLLQVELGQGVVDLAHAIVGHFRTAHEVALVVVALLAAHQDDAVVTAVERVGDPDGVDRTEAAHRDDTGEGTVLLLGHAGHVERRVGVVFAGEHQDTRLLGELIRNIDRLELLADGFHRVVLEGDDAYRAGAHAGTATAAAGLVVLRKALLVFVDGAERTLHGTAFALGTAFTAEAREGEVTGARMGGATLRGVFARLDRFQCGAGGIFHGLRHVHRTAYRAGAVDT